MSAVVIARSEVPMTSPTLKPVKNEEASRKTASPSRTKSSPKRTDRDSETGVKKEPSNVTQALAPPPRPIHDQSKSEALDYFVTSSGIVDTQLSREPNPFDRSFGQPAPGHSDTKPRLPGVASLTSPRPLPQEGTTAAGYFSSSLTNPLSPAMLGGPVSNTGGDYFSTQPGASFPGVTPNESGLRTGLTPGGGGSMFPAASPSSQAYINNLVNGGSASNTQDFHRTAITTAANKTRQANATRSQDTNVIPASSMDPQLQPNASSQSTFGQHDNDAASSLYLLAQSSNGQSAQNSAAPHNARHPAETSPTISSTQNKGLDMGDIEESKPSSRSRAKRSSGVGGSAVSRRKAEEASPHATHPSKKHKYSMPSDLEDDDDEDGIDDGPTHHADGKKMTDEEKRKNFLERNRVAALKCRQRKKQWLANLQNKVEVFTSENDSLTAQVHNLREEIMHLKTLLLQHKDCPVSQSQGLSHYLQQQQQQQQDYHNGNPYGMAALANGDASRR